jgi:type IV pilus assembly protein PilW
MALRRFAGQPPRCHQAGFTMVELLVAMAISLVIALAAVTALTVARRGFGTVDAASQLRDNGRFAADLIQRLVVQSGFKDVNFAGDYHPIATEISPNITGYNDAAVSALTAGTDNFNGAFSVTPTTHGINGSDILIVRNQLVDREPGPPPSGKADGSMIDCNGNSRTGAGTAPTLRGERSASILYVDNSLGEPSLMCATVNSQGTISNGQPIITGVETFQVLYGTMGVTAGTRPNDLYGITFKTTAGLPIATPTNWDAWTASVDGVANTYLRADQLTVAGDAVGTNANWRRVRSVRIGLILRGPPNSAQSTDTTTYYPFGRGKSSGTAAPGSGFADSTNDPGSAFTAPSDGRLRQVLTFTVHLRNYQGL